MLKLVTPAHKHRRAFWAYIRECQQAGESKIQGLYVLPRSYCAFLRDNAVNKYFLTADGSRKILGLVAFTPGLEPDVRRTDGDLAYSIAPSERGKGYGKRQLALALALCRDWGWPQVCVTCRKENAASAKIITANGGALAEEFSHDGVIRQVYWIA